MGGVFMAYEASKEKRTEYGEIVAKDGEKPEYIKVAKVEYGKGAPKMDIRLWFTAEDGKVCATQKGVRFSTEFTVEIVKMLINSLERNEAEELLNIFKMSGD